MNYDQIDTIIEAVGCKSNFNYINIPGLLDGKKESIHINGVALIDKFYYDGFPWLVTRKSEIIYGIQEDFRRIFALIREGIS
ncbi:hypothetical protein [Chryseobacterium sp. c4a]|uniref:hypothetical protein n=1 Tax=Chryseobacterium sp. c4a TaxID=1573582 RepID=UPI001356F41C|nr:hypothetical protein [Chryseobacterium sp. c4a]